jgi:C4-dicarboxylate-specific signal transduction histidine kinase
VKGSRVQLQQVLLNLILNAADAMSGNPQTDVVMTVRTESADDTVRLSVVDRGCGIAATDLKKVFDPFWSTKRGGMGMGLAISRTIVAAHGGILSACNNAERGATFCVALPMRS